MELRA